MPDSSVYSGPHLLNIIWSLTSLNVAAELLLVLFRVLSLEVTHVVSDVATEDVLTEYLRVEFLRLSVVAREALVLVGDLETTIDGSLHGSEDTSSSGGEVKSDVEENVERTTALTLGLHEEVLTIRLSLANILLIKSQLSENTAGAKESGSVG